MCKNPLHSEQEVFEATFDEAKRVDQAAKWAEALVTKVHRGPGDSVEAAMYRAETKYGVPFGTLWALRYRKPKAMWGGAWAYLKHVYEAECGRQEAKLRHELEMVRALPSTAAREALISEAEAALGTAESRTGTEG